MKKSFLKSKTLWANLVAAASVFIGAQYGYTLTPEQTAAILAAINGALRLITKEGLTV